MKMKFLLLEILLFLCLPISSQTFEVSDSTVTLGIEELRVLTKMTEDLRYTKSELEAADSIITHQEKIINLKSQEIREVTRKSKRKQVKVSLFSGIIGIIIGILLL